MTKSNVYRRRRSDVAPPVDTTPSAPAPRPGDDIARRAYELFCERGAEHGRDLDDWLQAERELRLRR